LRQLAAKGFVRVYLHLDGWGFRGYDNLIPHLPPSPKRVDGRDKRLAQTATIGLRLRDPRSYRDYYSSESYDPDTRSSNVRASAAPQHLDGVNRRCFVQIRAGLCPTQLILAARPRIKVEARTSTSSRWSPDGVLYPLHPRRGSDCSGIGAYAWTSFGPQGGVVSSEEPRLGIPHLDLSPRPVCPGPTPDAARLGNTDPLFICYHDALFLPGRSARRMGESRRTTWAIACLPSRMPYFRCSPTTAQRQVARCAPAQASRPGEMTRHEFLEGCTASNDDILDCTCHNRSRQDVFDVSRSD
jgi:hypothetical protein